MKRLGLISLLYAGIIAMNATVASAATSLEQGFLNAHQQQRIVHGLPRLTWNADLARVAKAHSHEMADAAAIWHSAEMPGLVRDWVVLGDNVGTGSGIEDLMSAFMASPGHRKNILDNDYREVGIGAVDNGRLYVTVIFRRANHAAKTVAKAPVTHKAEAREVVVLEQLLALDAA